MALLDDVRNTQNDMPPQGNMGMPTEEAMPEDDLINSAFESNEFTNVGVGVEMASEEEQMMLETVMDAIEEVIHGAQSQRIVSMIENANEPYEGIGMATHAIVLAAYMDAHKKGINIPSDVFLGENGAVQETTEMIWEIADAMNAVDINDEEQLAASYFNAMRLLGETMLEMDDPTAVASAQEFVLELELGHEVNSEDYLPSEDEAMMGDPMAQAGMAGSAQGGMPMPQPEAPIGPQQGQPPMPQQNMGY
jgi:hypothetical protein